MKRFLNINTVIQSGKWFAMLYQPFTKNLTELLFPLKEGLLKKKFRNVGFKSVALDTNGSQTADEINGSFIDNGGGTVTITGRRSL